MLTDPGHRVAARWLVVLHDAPRSHMQILGIRKLKATLKQRALTSREAAQYLAAQGVAMSLLFVPTSSDASVDWMYPANAIVALGGVFYCYRRNGGASGVRLAERALAIGWVVMCRTMVWYLPLLLAWLLGEQVLAGSDESAGWSMDASLVAVGAYMYWRMGVHLADVATTSVPVAEPLPPIN